MRTAWIAVALAAGTVATAALAQERGSSMTTERIAVGTVAPDFRLNDHGGRAVRLADLRGSAWVVLAFFPKAMTPG